MVLVGSMLLLQSIQCQRYLLYSNAMWPCHKHLSQWSHSFNLKAELLLAKTSVIMNKFLGKKSVSGPTQPFDKPRQSYNASRHAEWFQDRNNLHVHPMRSSRHGRQARGWAVQFQWSHTRWGLRPSSTKIPTRWHPDVRRDLGLTLRFTWKAWIHFFYHHFEHCDMRRTISTNKEL